MMENDIFPVNRLAIDLQQAAFFSGSQSPTVRRQDREATRGSEPFLHGLNPLLINAITSLVSAEAV